MEKSKQNKITPWRWFSFIYFLVKRDFKKFIRWEYFVGLLLIALLLLPMSWGLYQQFDLHPEKIMYGKQNVSGLRFFYWTQSFGRITGESVWNNGADFSFLYVNMLWAMMPWVIFFTIAYFVTFFECFKTRFSETEVPQLLPFIAFSITYLCLGSSKYQLPHYIFVAFPMAAILTANLIWSFIVEKKYVTLFKIATYVQTLVLALIWLISFSLIFYIFAENAHYWQLFLGVSSTVLIYILWVKNGYQKFKMIYTSIYTILIFNVLLIFYVYPTLLKYQMGSELGRYIEAEKIPTNQTYLLDLYLTHSLCFYSKHIFELVGINDERIKKDNLLITVDAGLEKLKSQKVLFETIKQVGGYRITMLNWKFLNPDTRDASLTKYYLVKIL